jgi:hypothetical protein
MLGPYEAGKTSFISMVGYNKSQMADVSSFRLFCCFSFLLSFPSFPFGFLLLFFTFVFVPVFWHLWVLSLAYPNLSGIKRLGFLLLLWLMFHPFDESYKSVFLMQLDKFLIFTILLDDWTC